MNASASNTIDWAQLVGLFRPGRGAMPPKLAGREAALAELAILFNDISKFKRAPTGDAVLYGPRGNGKTVLLDAFIQQCKDADVISLAPTQIRNEADLAALLLYEDQGFRRRLEEFKPRSGEINLKLLSAEWGRMDKADRDDHTRRHLVSLLAARARRKPLVVTLDEAHTLEPEVGRTLLNASQLVNRQRAPFLLVLAGTPNLRTHLNQMGTTFWNRSEKIGVGRLDTTATRAALVDPLEPYGIQFRPDALETVITESQHYPYFIQAWGRALCLTLRDRQACLIDTSIVDAARHRFTGTRIDYYKDPYEELQVQDLLITARSAANMFRDVRYIDAEILNNQLATDLSLDSQGALDAIRELSHLGFIWQPPASACYEPGIPSLMDYVLTERRELAGNQSPRHS